MNNRLTMIDATISADAAPRPELADVLERYLADLEQGRAPDEEALLAAHPKLAQELRPYLESVRMLHRAADEFRGAGNPANGAADDDYGRHPIEASPSSNRAGARQIGDYRIVREIGRGGMGIVYEAHQLSLNRRVALKILPFAAVLDQRHIARFRNEAQAAAQLHHPHIVPVFAVGQEQGVYYYAMQHIDGQSLEQAIGELREAEKGGERSTVAAGMAHGSTTTFCATFEQHDAPPSGERLQRRVENEARRQPQERTPAGSRRAIRHGDFFNTVARLGKQAAEALQHAHEYGVVHRDVKPSNLLIDNQGKLWVTDFGLARIQSGSGMTLTGDVVGTLRYMSPEQASGQSALVDARSDLYSLGVTLYELLTQRHAFPGEDRPSLLRRITADEPIPPRRHNPAVPVDLETIVLSAMAKSRDDRYASAQALADDLERFLAGKPTFARRPSLADRAAKWARRHRPLVAVAACAIVLLSLVSAAGVVLLAREQARTSAALRDAQEQAHRAQANLERAERHFQQARGAVDQLGVRIADRLSQLPGAENVRRDLLLDTLGYYRQFAAEAGDDPKLGQELAVAHFKSAAIATNLGATADAVTEYEAALRLFQELASGNPAGGEAESQLAVTHNNLGLLRAARGEADAARAHYHEALAIQRRLVDQHDDAPEFAGQLAETQANLGMLLSSLGDTAGAGQSLRAAVDVLRRLVDAFPSEPKHHRNLAIACNNLSYVVRSEQPAEAADLAGQAVARLEKLVQEQPASLQFHDDLALCCNNLAALHAQRDELSAAVELHQRAIAIQEQLARKAPAVVRHRSDLAVSLNNLGVVHCSTGRPADADAVFARAREIFTALADDYPDEVAYRSALAALLNNQGLALAKAGRHEDALRVYPTAIESQRACLERWSSSPLMREALSKMYYNYGQSLRAAARYEEAVEAALARRELWQRHADRLFAVAVELAEIHRADSANISRQMLDAEVVTTLRQATERGWTGSSELATDERFSFLQGNQCFGNLIKELADE